MSVLKEYDAEAQGRAVGMYADRVVEGDISQLRACEEIGELLGFNQSMLRDWIRRDLGEGATPAVDAGPVDAGVTWLWRENAQLRRANEILRRSSVFFVAAELDRELGQERVRWFVWGVVLLIDRRH